MKSALLVALVAAGLLGALKFLVARMEPRAAFFPFRGEQDTPASANLAFERVALRPADGEVLAAWWLPAAPGAPEVLFFHGNGGNLSVWLDVIAGIRRQGWSILAIDYRGYGTSTGRPTEQGVYRDADAALEDFWSRRHTEGARTFYWGRSLGATVAAYAAARRAPDGLILESPLYSARSLIADNPLMRLLGVFMSYRFATAEWLRRYRGPTIVVHGDADRVIPLRHGRRVHDEVTGRKELVVIPGADHNDLHLVGPGPYWAALRRFVTSTAE
jgi:hypothetical protein